MADIVMLGRKSLQFSSQFDRNHCKNGEKMIENKLLHFKNQLSLSSIPILKPDFVQNYVTQLFINFVQQLSD